MLVKLLRQLLLGLVCWLTSASPGLAQAIGGQSNILSGTITGTYTLGGTPTITGLTTINGGTLNWGLDPITNGAANLQSQGNGGTVQGEVITLAGGTFTTAATVLVVTTIGNLVSTTPVSGGSGGANDACTVQGTTGTASGGRMQLSGIVSGGVLQPGLSVVSAGVYQINPTTPSVEPVTPIVGCAGLTGATINMTMKVWDWRVDQVGYYTTVPTNPVTQGTSTGSTTGSSFNVAWKNRSSTGWWFDTLSGVNVYRTETPDTQSLFLGSVVTGPALQINNATFNQNNTGRNVNYVYAQGSQAGRNVAKISATGTDPIVQLWHDCSGTGCWQVFNSGTDGSQFQIRSGGVSTVNFLSVIGGTTGVAPQISAVNSNDAVVDINLVPKSTGIVKTAAAMQVGSATSATLSAGEFAHAKITASGIAPGAGFLKISAVAGTNAGTCKLIAYAGTSTTPVTIVDNVGASC